MVKEKGLKEILEEYTSLKIKITYKEYQDSIQNGFNDNSIEEAYKEYCKVRYMHEK